MLVDEARIAVRLDHPNIVRVYELAQEGEAYYVAMEFVSGTDVRRLLRESARRWGALPEDVALFITTEVLEGLSYAHARKDAKGRPLGIVHRDVSPQNILVSADGSVKIADFGIAKAASRTHETATGVLKGKYAYMSPEQASQDAIDGRSDLFSAAIVLYEMLAGERLFYRGSDVETLDLIRRARVSPSPEALRAIGEPLWEILEKAFARRPSDRYATAAEFRDALRGYARRRGLRLGRDRLADFLRSMDAEATVVEGMGEEVTESATRTIAPQVLVDRDGTLTELARQTRLEDLPPLKRSIRPAVLVAGTAGLFLLFALWALVSDKQGRDVPVPPEIEPPRVAADIPPETLPAVPATPEHSAADFESPPVVALPKAEVRSSLGYLTVQAVPWGEVSVDGGRRRWQTPVRRMRLSAGRHTVRVVYEPDGISLSSAIRVVSGKEIVCVAKFRGGKELRCGN